MGEKNQGAVFEFADKPIAYPNGEVLPGIWITVPSSFDEKGHCDGRDYLTVYPASNPLLNLLINFKPFESYDPEQLEQWRKGEGYDPENYDPDPDGFQALELGGVYYDEGMNCVDVEELGRRADAFRAAELLYLHSQARGNVYASLCLGYVYSYNRCEDVYCYFWLKDEYLDIDIEERTRLRNQFAFEAFEKAALAGIPEGLYKYGDCFSAGIGCDVNPELAFQQYQNAAKQSSPALEDACVQGSIEQRLGKCYENGEGCECNLEKAKEHYERACKYLQDAVDNGDWYYEKVLAQTKKALKRVQQLAGY